MKNIILILLVHLTVTHANEALLHMAKGNYSKASQSISSSAGTSSEREELLLKARSHFLNRKYSKAITLYSKIIKTADSLEPAFTKAHFGIAESYASTKEFQKAEEHYGLALEILSSREMKEKTAMEFITEAKQIFSDESNLRVDAAISYLNIAQKILKEGELFEEVEFLKGEIYFHKENYAKCSDIFFKFSRNFPESTHYFEALHKGAISTNRVGGGSDARHFIFKILNETSSDSLRAEALLLLAESYHMPNPENSEDLLNGVDVLKEFVESYPNHVAIDKARYDMAISSLSKSITRPVLTDSLSKYYLSNGESKDKRAQISFNRALSSLYQGKDSEAIMRFEAFIKEYPYHEQTQEAHKEIERIWWNRGKSVFDNEQWEEAITHFELYISRYPELKRTGEAYFKTAQSWLRLSNEKRAKEYFSIVSSKFHKEKIGGEALHEQALLILKNDPSSKEAFNLLDKKQRRSYKSIEMLENWGDTLLEIQNGHPFYSDEKPFLKTNLRNIDSVEISLYEINEEQFFREQLSMFEIPNIAIDLSKPKIVKTFIPKQIKTKTTVTEEIPIPIKEAGIYLVKLKTGNLEAVTTVSVSDIRAIMKESARGTFLFVENAKTGAPVSGADILISNHKEIILETETDKRGICQTNIRSKRGDDKSYQVFIKAGSHITWISPAVDEIKKRNKQKKNIRIITDKYLYTKSDTTKILIPPFKDEITLSVADSNGTIIMQKDLPPSSSMTHLFVPPHRQKTGQYKITAKERNEQIIGKLSYRVKQNDLIHKMESYRLETDLNDSIFYNGDTVEIRINLSSNVGKEVGNRAVIINSDNPHNATDTIYTDKHGAAQYRFSLDSSIISSVRNGIIIQIPSLNLGKYETVYLLKEQFSLRSSIPSKVIYPDETFQIQIKGYSRIHEGISKKAEIKLYKKNGKGEKLLSIRAIDILIDTVNSMDLKTDTSGTFRVEIESSDEKGNRIFSESKFTVRDEIDNSREFMSISLDDSIYTPNEKVSATIESNIKKGHILFTFESDSIVDYYIHKVTKSRERLALPIGTSMVPNITVSAASVINRDELSNFSQKITVSKELNVNIETEDTANAGDSVTLKFAVTDIKDRAKRANISLFITENQQGKNKPHNLYRDFYRYNHHTILTNGSELLYTDEVTAKEVGSLKIIESNEVAGMKEFQAVRKKLTKLAKEEYASGMGSGFGGSSGGVDDLLGSLMGGGGSSVNLKKRKVKAPSGASSAGLMGYNSWIATSIGSFINKSTDENGILTLTIPIPDSIQGGFVINAFAHNDEGYIGSRNITAPLRHYPPKDRELPIVQDSEKLIDYSFSPDSSGDSVYPDVKSFIKALPINFSLYREHALYGIYLKAVDDDPEKLTSNLITLLTGGTEPLLSSNSQVNSENFITAAPLLMECVDEQTPWIIKKKELSSLVPELLKEIKKEKSAYVRLKLLLTVAQIDPQKLPAVTLQRLDRQRKSLDEKSLAILAQIWEKLDRRDRSRQITSEVINNLGKSLTEEEIDFDALIHSLELLQMSGENPELILRGMEKLVTSVLPKILHSPNRLASTIQLLHKIYAGSDQSFSITRRPVDSEVTKQFSINRCLIPVPVRYMGQKLDAISAIVEAKSDTSIDINSLNRYGFLAVKIIADDSLEENFTLTEKIPLGFTYIKTPGGKKGFYNSENRELAFICNPKDTLIYLLKAETEGEFTFTAPKISQKQSWRMGNQKRVRILPESVEISHIDLPKVSEERGDIARKNGRDELAINFYEEAYRVISSKSLLKRLLFTSIELKDYERIVNYFEEAKEESPNLLIPFEKLEVIQDAYRKMKLYESGYLLNRGIADSRFIEELNVVGTLEGIKPGDHLYKKAYQKRLNSLPVMKRVTTAYPHSDNHARSLYLFAHLLYDRIDNSTMVIDEKADLLKEIETLLSHYLGEYRNKDREPQGIYTRASASLDQKDFRSVINWCYNGPDNSFNSYIDALKAYAYFLKDDYKNALKIAERIVDSTEVNSHHNYLGRYLKAQIFHGQGNYEKAVPLYKEVAHIFSDARDIVSNSIDRSLILPEIVRLKPNETEIPITVTNIDTVTITSYPIDLVAFLQRRGSLQNTEKINLSGITPAYIKKHTFKMKIGIEQKLELGSGIVNNGAYISFIQTPDTSISTIVIKGDIELAVNRSESGGVHVSVGTNRGTPVNDATVLIKGARKIVSGKSDKRGVFQSDILSTPAAVIVKKGESYGVYLPENRSKNVTVSIDVGNISSSKYNSPKELLTEQRVINNMGNFFNQTVEGILINQLIFQMN